MLLWSVDRRIGGLEKFNRYKTMHSFVDRRIGGLEMRRER